MSIKHIIFDGFGTLVYRKEPMNFRAMANTHSDVLIQWDEAMLRAFDWMAWSESVGLKDTLLQDLNTVEVYGDIDSTVDMLRARGIEFSVMSNLASCFGEPLQKALERFSVAHWFLSYKDEMKKPDPNYYAYALECIGGSPQDILFVGDHGMHDVAAPIAAGMRGIQIQRKEKDMRVLLEPWC